MRHKTQDEWAALITEQQSSDLTIVDFCKEHGLATSSFYKFRKRLQPQGTPAKFIQAKAIGAPRNEYSVNVSCGAVSISVPLSCEPVWLANFIKALQA